MSSPSRPWTTARTRQSMNGPEIAAAGHPTSPSRRSFGWRLRPARRYRPACLRSGAGATIMTEEAGVVLADYFPSLAAGVRLHLPDEKSRRVGQAIAAASLPDVPETR